MHSIQIIYHGHSFKFSGPSDWSECNARHLREIGKTPELGLSTMEAKVVLATKLYDIPGRLFLKLDPEQRTSLVRLTSFIDRPKSMDKNQILSFRKGLIRYYGPSDQYDNVTALEFAYAEICYVAFLETREMSKLDDLIAILYRPRRFFGIKNDIRRDFYERSANIRSRKFKRLPVALKYSILFNYEGWRNWIITSYPEVFAKDEDSEDSEESEPTGNSTSLWTRIYRMIAESGVFGTYDQVCRQEIIVLFAQLSEKIFEAKKAKEELEKLKRR